MSTESEFIMSMEEWAGVYMGHSFAAYFAFLKNAGISMQQAYALTYLHYNAPSKISEICEHMMVSAAAASQMVDRLEKQELVTRVPDSEDRRVRNVVLTEPGQRFVLRSIAARQRWVDEIPVDLDQDQMEWISSALQLLISVYREQ